MNMNLPHQPTRRGMIRSMVGGSMLLPGLVGELLAAESAPVKSADPLAPKPGHFPAKAKRVIFLHMSGGVSHVDSWDPKPKLLADAGKTIPVNEFQGRKGDFKMFLTPPSWKFAKRSIGSWLSYGLGTFNRNLPSFVVIAPQSPYAGGQVWGSDFLPGSHQGTLVLPGAEPVANIQRRAPNSRLQEMELAMMAKMNQRHLDARPTDPLLSARMKSFETAFGMQAEMPEVFDLSKETDATLKLYGLERGSTKGFAWQCLVARRLAERGVRFVELIDVGSSNNWDAHGDMMTHSPLAKNVDQPIAGLLKDLRQRGMLDETLVVWTTEFGRTPFNSAAGARGREHHHWVFSSWLAGGGVKPGMTYGESDEYGINVGKSPVHVHDFHATILHLMGLDHERLTYRSSGRDYRLTDVHGRVVKEILA